MPWLALWSIVALTGVIGALAAFNRRRLTAIVAREAADLFRLLPEARTIAPSELEHLPAPVRRYLTKVLGPAPRAVRAVKVRHSGAFRTALDGDWRPIRGEEYLRADPPGFVWWGRLRLLPGLWMDARDRSVDGLGHMTVWLESSVTVADAGGPELDQGGLLRLLGELTWLPSALLDARYVTWTSIDDYRAGATLRVDGQEVRGVFEFGSDDLPRAFTAERYRSQGKGRSVLTPFTGEYRDYREVGGLLVPTVVVGYWHVDGQRIPYARFHVDALACDQAALA